MESVEESRLRRPTIFWKQSRPDGGRFVVQVGQNSLDHRRVFNAGNDLDLPGAPLTGLNIDIKYPLEPLHPGHRLVALGRRLVQPALPGRLTPLTPPAPFSRSDTHTKLAIWSEHPMNLSLDQHSPLIPYLWHYESDSSSNLSMLAVINPLSIHARIQLLFLSGYLLRSHR